ncbi:MAG: hypothetical protein UT66_C0037G0007 [candidate division CPR2 bacterium GW2011_GWC1_39_9]|nr:MAG: hypothetical protein UT66_C0037G0007 [candidate division CPR2 bacterium GW2011_GWC1_39_9]
MPVFLYNQLMSDKKQTRTPKKNAIEKKRTWLKKVLVASGIGLIAAIPVYFVAVNWPTGKKIDLGISKKAEEKQVITTLREELKYEMPLSGIKVAKENITKRRPIAVSIENSPNARPQSGLDKAEIIYEAVAEGGITRYLAFFQRNEPNEIGPVRSARTYFVDFVAAYDAIFVHFGGSEIAKTKIFDEQIKEIDGIVGEGGFWRDSTRESPHNAYTSYSKIQAAIYKKGYSRESETSVYLFKEDMVLEKRPKSQNININFSGGGAKNAYKRILGGTSHKDRVTSKELYAKNIVIQEVMQYSSDSTEQHSKKTIGSGNATIYLDGNKIDATWKKPSLKSPTRFYDKNDREIEFNRGQTWFEVLTQSSSFNDSGQS